MPIVNNSVTYNTIRHKAGPPVYCADSGRLFESLQSTV